MSERQVIRMRGMLGDAALAATVPGGVEVRPLGSGDGPALGALMADGYRGSVDDGGEDEAWHLDEAEGTLGGRYGPVRWDGSFVAVSGEEVVGTSLVTFSRGRLLLAFAVVARAWHGHGVGTALIARSACGLVAAGEREWVLAVTVGNPARTLYERLGFTPET